MSETGFDSGHMYSPPPHVSSESFCSVVTFFWVMSSMPSNRIRWFSVWICLEIGRYSWVLAKILAYKMWGSNAGWGHWRHDTAKEIKGFLADGSCMQHCSKNRTVEYTGYRTWCVTDGSLNTSMDIHRKKHNKKKCSAAAPRRLLRNADSQALKSSHKFSTRRIATPRSSQQLAESRNNTMSGKSFFVQQHMGL